MKIDKIKVYGFEPALRGMRNAKNSWDRIDSGLCKHYDCEGCPTCNCVTFDEINSEGFLLGQNDLKLAQNLIKAGEEHGKFMRQIQVWMDMDMTRFFWSEMDTYKYNTKNSCSTMHKFINPNSAISIDMFDYYKEDEDVVQIVIDRINQIRDQFLSAKDFEKQRILKRRAKTLLLEGFLQLRTVNTNYAELRHILLQRKQHQLREDWQDEFCKTLTTLPYAKELIFCGLEDDYERLSNL